MSNFDSVILDCISCGKQHALQSKAGECRMDSFDPKKVPMAIGADMLGRVFHCTSCETVNIVGSTAQTHITLNVYEP